MDDFSILKELKEFESVQEAGLEKKKSQFLASLEKQKKEILEKNEMEIYELSSGRNDIIKQAHKKAKEQAVSSINSFREKTKKIQDSSARAGEAISIIFTEFLRQNV